MFPQLDSILLHIDLYTGKYTNFFNSTVKIVLSSNAGMWESKFWNRKKNLQGRGNTKPKLRNARRESLQEHAPTLAGWSIIPQTNYGYFVSNRHAVSLLINV